MSNAETSKVSRLTSRTPSPGSGASSVAASTSLSTLRCSTATPFGRPVDPDVYMT